MIQAKPSKQSGFLLITVVVTLAVLAAMAMMLSTSTSHDNALVANHTDSASLDYLAESGMEHAKWQLAQNTTCASYSDIPATPFGPNSYSAIVAPTNSSPVTITATGSLSSGAQRILSQDGIRVYSAATQNLTLQPGPLGEDTYIWDGAHKDTNFGATSVMELNNASAERVALLRFDLSAIPAGSHITSAILELYLEGGSAVSNGVVDAHRVTQSWFEGEEDNNPPSAPGATYMDYDGTNPWASPGGDFDPTPVDSTVIPNLNQGWYQWDVSVLAQDGSQSEIANNGVLLRASGGNVDKIKLTSSDGNAAERPKLIVTYACECGPGCSAPFAGGGVLMVVMDPDNIDANEQIRKTLIESWGYAVTLIDDSDSQANFDAAVVNHDVAYVPALVSDTELNTKLTNAPIGVVIEVPELLQEFGIANDRAYKDRDEIDIIDNTHYITSPFPLGVLTIYSGIEPSYLVFPTLAPDLQVLGLMANVGSGWSNALTVLDTGAALYTGGNAAGRRVTLPWENLDFSSLNADGQTLMRRALEWGAGLGSEPPPNFVIATEGTATLGGLTFTDKDLVEYQPSNDTANLFFDGAAAALSQDIDAFHYLENGRYVLSAINTTTLGGLTFDNEDLALYDAATDSANMLFDGSALFTSGSTDISALHVTSDGHYLLSNEYSATLGGLSFTPSDIVDYDPASDTATMLLDGSTVGLTAWIDAVHLLDTGNIVLSVDGSATLGGLSFGDGDLVEYDPATDTANLYFDEGLFSADEDVRSVHIGAGSGTLSGGAGASCDVDTAGTYFEAENYSGTIDGINGLIATESSTVGFNGSGYLRNIGGDNFTPPRTEGRTYEVNFNETGTYKLWIRGHAIDGFSDSDFLGLDGTVFGEYHTNGIYDQWLWSNGVRTGGTNQFDVFTAGSHTITVWNRERDMLLDSIYITKGSETPSGGIPSDATVVDPSSCGGGGGGSCEGTFRDEFNAVSYGNNDGTLNFSTDWIEINESNGPTSGDERVEDTDSKYHLQVRDNDGGGEGVQREADLSKFTQARLSFEYRRDGFDNSNDYVMLQVSNNGGGKWDQIDQFTGPGTDKSYVPKSYDISAYISANTQIRFLTSPDHGSGDELYVDNVQILVKGCR